VTLVLKFGLLVGSKKYEWCFDAMTLLHQVPRWLLRPTPELPKASPR